MSGNSSRKPSGSSTHSGVRSPLSSPNNGQSQRNLNTTTVPSMYGVGIGNSNGRKGLNSGWQVWGSATPSSKRNVSVSPATSVNDLQPSSSDSNYHGTFGEGWAASGPTAGAWEDVNEVPQKKSFAHAESHSQRNLHQARQGPINVAQAHFSGPRFDDRPGVPKNGQFLPQQYDNIMNRDSNLPRFSSGSPRPFGITTYSSIQSAPQAPGTIYDGLQASSPVNDELSLALRGMAVEDDYHQQRQHPITTQSVVHSRGPHPMPQPRPYGPYPQVDYNSYYAAPPSREPYTDYPYGYETYRSHTDPSMYGSPSATNTSPASVYPSITPQGLHTSIVPDIHRAQPGPFFDYGLAAHSPYYSAHQPVLYQPPTHSPITPQVPVLFTDKKREFQQISSQNLAYGPVRSTPSPLPQSYAVMEYAPLMIQRGVYGPNFLHIYPHNIHPIRRNNIEPPPPLRSPLLDEFRADKARKWELRDIFGFIVEFSGDQHGSRFIQQKLESATTEEKEIVFNEIVPNNALQLIQDVFGNYVIQKLFEHGTQVQKTTLVNTMEGHVLPLSLQMYGCRVVQKAIEYVLPEHQSMIVRELEPHVLKCVKDSNGNHVIQKIIERVLPDRLGFVNAFRGNVFDLATHPYGCRVLQRCLENLPDVNTLSLMEELHRHTVNLMQDQFGNYVIQYILEHGKEHDKAFIVSKLRGQVLQMARHKFASNVCEKALVCTDPDTRRTLIEEMMIPRQDGVTPIVTMMKDQYANYVLQRALAVVEGEQRDALVGKIKPQLVSMRRYANAYTKHLNSIERLIEKYPQPLEQPPQIAVTPSDHTR